MSDHAQALRAEVMWEGEVKETDLPVRSLRVNVDGSGPLRRTLSCEIEADERLIPKGSFSRLAPYGAELRISGGWWDDTDPTIAADRFSRPNGPLGTTETGQAWRYLGPQWEITNGTARMVYADVPGSRWGAAVIDCNTPNVRANARRVAGGTAGLALRAIDADNLLTVAAVGSGTPGIMDVYLTRWDNANPLHLSMWTSLGLVDHLMVVLEGAQVTVWANGEKIGTHSLSPADLSKYSQGTAHGLWSWQGSVAQPEERFDDFTVERLRPGQKRSLYPGGVFRIDTTSIVHSPDERAIRLEGKDRSISVDAGGFWRTTTVQPGDDIVDRIADMLLRALPGVETNFAAEAWAAPRLLVWEEGDSPWTACRELAESIGMEIFFDAAGTVVLRKVPSVVHTVPAVDYVAGDAQLTSIERSWTTTGGFNRYTVVGQDENNRPVRGDYWDDEPTSPTYYGGPFGRRSAPVIRDPAVGSARQAVSAARGHLLRDRGGTEEVEVVTSLDWRREAGDVARLDDDEIGLHESAVLDRITYTVGPNTATMALATAAKRTVVEEENAA